MVMQNKIPNTNNEIEEAKPPKMKENVFLTGALKKCNSAVLPNGASINTAILKWTQGIPKKIGTIKQIDRIPALTSSRKSTRPAVKNQRILPTNLKNFI